MNYILSTQLHLHSLCSIKLVVPLDQSKHSQPREREPVLFKLHNTENSFYYHSSLLGLEIKKKETAMFPFPFLHGRIFLPSE